MVTTITDSLKKQHIYDSETDSDGSTRPKLQPINKSPPETQLKVISPAKVTPPFNNPVCKRLIFTEQLCSQEEAVAVPEKSFQSLGNPNRVRAIRDRISPRRRDQVEGLGRGTGSCFEEFYRQPFESPPFLTSDSSGSSNSSFNTYGTPPGQYQSKREIRSAESQRGDSSILRMTRSHSLQIHPSSIRSSVGYPTSNVVPLGGVGAGDDFRGRVRPLKRRFSDDRPSIDFIKMKRSILTPTNDDDTDQKRVIVKMDEKESNQMQFHINSETDSEDDEVSMISKRATEGGYDN